MHFSLSSKPTPDSSTPAAAHPSRPSIRTALIVMAVLAALAASLLAARPASAASNHQSAPKHKVHLVAKKGDHGKKIRVLQRRLDFKNINGHFGGRTFKGVKKWQRQHDRHVTGRVNSAMWRALHRQHVKAKAKSTLNWDALARCEAGGNWHINTGNGYYGGLQFSASTWHGTGGRGLPHQASKTEQIKRGTILFKRSGASPWPACGPLLFS